nr:hypothetical protein [uncultured Campylobacter sp.]
MTKFANLTPNFTHRDPYLENVKFNLRVAQQLLTCSGVGEASASLR